MAAGKATLHELQTVYSVQDAHDMLEILNISAHNATVLAPRPRGT